MRTIFAVVFSRRFFSVGLGLILAASPPAYAGVQVTIYASATGSGTAGTREAPCSLTGARDLVRTLRGSMTGDIVVNLLGGTYELKEPFRLEESDKVHDSGTGGFNIIYQAAPGETPVISGGLLITGWKLFDKDKNIYRAKVPEETQSRQLYIDERRAIRARGPDKPEGWTCTDTGWTITDATMVNWRNPDDIEIVSRSSWKHLRCGIASISGTTVTMKMPGWQNCHKSPKPGNPWNGGGTQEMKKVDWVENAFELLTQPGQWYLDRKEAYLYYIPLQDEDINKISAVLPELETLVDAHGTSPAQRLHNVEFKGITFKYATWMGPSGDQGYADNQAGVLWVNLPPVSAKTPGGLAFEYTSDVRFERNVIAHMGGCALDVGHAPRKDVILGNCIYDISGNGIFLGEVDDYAANDPAAWTDSDTIKDNYIAQIGREYEDQVGICTGYARNLLVDHNEIYDTPYSGISVGWGWSKMGYSFRNTISNNEVHKFMKILEDGGGIYTLGNQGDASNLTVWSGNYIHQGGHAQGLYADEGSGFMEIKGNLVCHVGANWMNIWTHSIHDINVHDNFADKTNVNNKGTNTTIDASNDMTIKPETLTGAAQAVAQNAGLEPDYADIKKKIPPPAFEVIDDTDPSILYTGHWTPSGGRKAGDYNDNVHSSGDNGASASFSFTGKGLDFITETNKDEGDVEVRIDGTAVKTVNCVSPDRVGQVVVYHQDWEKEGPHTIKLEKKTGGYILVDAFKVYHAKPQLH